MPKPRQKQGIGGTSSIAYKRWEPFDENDIDDNETHFDNRKDDYGQVIFILNNVHMAKK